MNRCGFLLATSILVLLSGHIYPAAAQDDIRQPILLTEGQRNFVLEEMRAFLETLRVITVALGKDDMSKVAEAAEKVGMAASGGVRPELREKLPAEFRSLAMRTHKGFDLIALDAADMEDKQHTLEQLGALMNNCVSCHAMFRLDSERVVE